MKSADNLFDKYRWREDAHSGHRCSPIKVSILKTMVLGISIPASQKIGATPCLISVFLVLKSVFF